MTSVKEGIGSALEPILRVITGEALKAAKAFQVWLYGSKGVIGALPKIKKVGLIIAAVIKGIINTVKVFVRAAWSLITSLFSGIAKSASVMFGWLFKNIINVDALKKAVKSLNWEVDKTAVKGVAAGQGISKAMKEAAARVKDIQKAIQAENASFKDQLVSVVKGIKERLKVNRDNLKEEEESFIKSQEERTKKFKEEQAKIGEEEEARIQSLERDMAEYLQIGSDTYEEDLRNFQAAMSDERAAVSKKLADTKADFDEETATQKEAYEKRTNALQEKINKDEAILEKHREDIKGLNLNIQKDEIDILKETHRKRLEALNEQLVEEKNSRSESNKDMLSDWSGMNNSMVADFGDSIGQIESMTIDLSEIIKWGPLREKIRMGLRKLRLGKMLLTIVFGDFSGVLIKALGALGSQPQGRKQAGGMVGRSGVYTVGEFGKEDVYLPKGARVANATETAKKGERGSEIKMTNNFFNTEIDPNALSNRLMFQLNTIT